MEVFLALILACSTGSIWDEIIEPDAPPSDMCCDQEVFWPPDMIPHPTVPGDGPSGRGEPELA